MTDLETTIAKLLAKAEGTTNAHEAEAFMAKAEELMLKHGIERAQLEAKRPGATRKTTPIVKERITLKDGNGYADALRSIGFAIGPNFSVRVLQSNNSWDNSKTVWFVGHEDDVRDVITLFNSLTVQAVPQAKAWWRSTGKPAQPWASDNDAYLARREFIYGFARGAGDRLRETRNRVVADSAPGAELVLVDRAKVVDRWMEENMRVGIARGGHRRSGGMDARTAGKQAGRDAVGNRSISR